MERTIKPITCIKANSKVDKINIANASDILPQPIDWLWHKYIAKGKLHIFAGVAGTAKTTIAIDLAARLSVGGYLPDGTPAPCGSTVMWAGEDDLNDTLIPRLIAAGANRDKIGFIIGSEDKDGKKRSFDPSKDIPLLEQHINRHPDISLIIIDPIISLIQGESNSNLDVRRSLQPLVELGIKYNIAIIGITHFSKGTKGKSLLDRVTGSLAFGATARIVLIAEKVEGEENMYVFAVAKANICDDNRGLYYSIEEAELSEYPEIYTTAVKWGGEIKCDIHELLVNNNVREKKLSAIQEAKDFLFYELEFKSAEVNHIEELAESNNISNATFKRARKELGIISKKVGFGAESTAYISLPAHVITQQ